MTEEESRHCVASLRFKEGDEIFVTDGNGTLVKARLLKANPKACIAETIENEQFERNKTFRRLVIAPPKTGERLDLIIEKATEIGVDDIYFIETRFSERDKVNLERLNKIAVSAMKQSKQLFIPNLIEMVKWKKFIEQPLAGTNFIAAIVESHDTIAGSSFLGTLLTKNLVYAENPSISILIGPEGDFSDDEVKEAIAKGFIPVSLGKNILRTETAAIYALSLINAFS